MYKYLLLAALCLLACLLPPSAPYQPAQKFLNSLNAEQKAQAHLEFTHMGRQFWHFLPGEMWPRPGIRVHDLTPAQREALAELMKSFLSEAGYEKTQQIIGLESVLAELENNTLFRDPEKYNVAFYGNPGKDSLWAWSFEGHHVSLNFTIRHDEVSATPRFLGASPAIIQEGPRKGEQTLAKEQNLALELIQSLVPTQREQAIFQEHSFFEVVSGNATEVGPLAPVGIPVKDLNPVQQQLLKSLLQEYLATMPDKLAASRWDQIAKEDWAAMRFGWAGATQLGEAHYYRIQGKTFLVEFDNTQNEANHIHTVWRDFDGDFGRDLIREHYQHAPHHKHD
ncbi:MAG: DUF3500 domain-containing protein [Bacteroidota bacterium]